MSEQPGEDAGKPVAPGQPTPPVPPPWAGTPLPPPAYPPPAYPPAGQAPPGYTPSPPQQPPWGPPPYAGYPNPYGGYPGGAGWTSPPPGYDPALGQHLATWGRRVGAYCLDILVLIVPLVVVFIFLGHHHKVLVQQSTGRLFIQTRWTYGDNYGSTAIAAAIWFAYYTACVAWHGGRTIGMGALKLSVRVAADGTVPTLGRAAGRAACWFVSVIPFAGPLALLLDFLWPLWDNRRQALHDKIAGTVVIDQRPRPY